MSYGLLLSPLLTFKPPNTYGMAYERSSAQLPDSSVTESASTEVAAPAGKPAAAFQSPSTYTGFSDEIVRPGLTMAPRPPRTIFSARRNRIGRLPASCLTLMRFAAANAVHGRAPPFSGAAAPGGTPSAPL